MPKLAPLRRLWLAVVLAGLAPVAARAQSSQGSVQGRVINQASGDPIAKALVIERNLLTNTQSYRYTNEQGFFSFPALPAGTYTVRADAMDFEPKERSPVELAVAARIELNFSLARSGPAPAQPSVPVAPTPGANPRSILAIMYGADAAVPQAVLVRLPVSQVETLIGTISSLVDETKILELPLSGRDVYTLLVLQPNVSSDNATARGLGFSVNGQQSSSSNFLLDGVDNNDLQVTGPATKVSADAVREYRMSTNNFTAEYGRVAGTIANVITRSGTNQVHGSLFEFFNDDQMNANSFSNNWQDLSKDIFWQHQFGGTLGGPLVRDRLFVFGNFEQLRSFSDGQPVQLLVPTPLLVSLAAPNSIAKKLWSQFPPPAGEPLPGIFYAALQTLHLPLVQRNSFALGRGDYSSLDGRHRISARYAFSQNTQDDFVINNYPELNTPLVVRGQNLSLNYTRDLYGGTNELKFGFNRNSVQVLRPHPEIPTFTSGDGITLPGSDAAYDYMFRDTVFHALDNYSRLRGGHAMVMGFEWRPYLHDSLLSAGRDGRYGFGSVFDFLSDQPFLLQITLNRQSGLAAKDSDFWRYYFQNEMAAFFQDNWKLTRRLTLNLGLRWEYFGAPAARNGTQDYNFVFGSGGDITQRIATGKMEAGQLYRPDRNNFAPRFGFALDLTGSGRSVLRGGFGVFFDRIFNNFWMDARSNNLSLASLFLLPPFLEQFRYTIPARNAIVNGSTALPSDEIAVDRGLRTPYGESWFIGLQQQLTPNLVLEVNQTGSVARKLAASDVINRGFSLPITNTNPNGRFNPNEPDISYRSNQGKSDHIALQVAVNRRWSQGMQFQASYTLGRSRDVQSDPVGNRAGSTSDRRLRLAKITLFQTSAQFVRQFDPAADYGNSDFDQRQNLVFNFIAQMPHLLGVPQFFSGWQAAAMAGFRTGFPFSVLAGLPAIDPKDTLSAYGYIEPGRGFLQNNRADYWGKDLTKAFLVTPPEVAGGLTLLDKTKFASPAWNQIGNSQRNAFRGPGFWNVDLSLSRSFALPRIGERTSLQFRAEFFNLFNHTNLNNPDSKLGSSTFGDAVFGRTGVGSSSPGSAPLNDQPRHVQLALKMYF